MASIALSSEVRRLKGKYAGFHDHKDVRQFIIRAALADAKEPIVVFGDSIAEMAPLPRELCGHPVINAGIGGLGIVDAAVIAPRLLSDHSPFMIVGAVGGNDIGSGSAYRDYSNLIQALLPLAPRLLLVSVIPDRDTDKDFAKAAQATKISYFEPQLPMGSKMADGIHYTAAAYRAWLPPIEAAILKACE